MDYLFIVNPESHSIKNKGSVLESVKLIPNTHIERVSDFGAMPDLVEEAAKSECKWVFIEGGDGTVHGVLTAFMRARTDFDVFPRFTILPGGMTNQVARNIGLKRASRRHIETLIATDRGREIGMPLLALDVAGGPEQFGFVFSSGGIPSATKYCTNEVYDKGLGGMVAVAATIVRGVAGSQRIRDDMMPATSLDLRITGDKEEIHLTGEHLASLVTTLPSLVMHMDPFWGQGQGPLRLTYARADAKRFIRNLAGIWAGRKAIDRRSDGFESFNASALHYTYDGPVVLDGENISLPEARVDIRPSEPVIFVS